MLAAAAAGPPCPLDPPLCPAPSPAVLYSLTRLLQTGVLVWLFVVSYSEMAGCGQSGLWWGNLVLFSVISVVQIYTVRACPESMPPHPCQWDAQPPTRPHHAPTPLPLCRRPPPFEQFPLYLGVLRRSVTAAKRTVQRVGTSLRRMGTATMRRCLKRMEGMAWGPAGARWHRLLPLSCIPPVGPLLSPA